MDTVNLDKIAICSMLEYCKHIHVAYATFGYYMQNFQENVVYQNALSFPILMIQEISKNLSENFKKANPSIAWDEICKMQVCMEEEFMEIDLDAVWNAARENIPVLQDFCETYLLHNP